MNPAFSELEVRNGRSESGSIDMMPVALRALVVKRHLPTALIVSSEQMPVLARTAVRISTGIRPVNWHFAKDSLGCIN